MLFLLGQDKPELIRFKDGWETCLVLNLLIILIGFGKTWVDHIKRLMVNLFMIIVDVAVKYIGFFCLIHRINSNGHKDI